MLTVISNLHALLFLVLNLFYSMSFAQSTDSNSIATFFSPQNLPYNNQVARDSLYRLVKGNPRLNDIYKYEKINLSLITGKLDEAKESSENNLKNFDGNLPDFAKAKYLNVIGKVHASRQESQKAISFFQKALKLSEDANEGTHAAMMNSNIANIYFSLIDYESAYKYVMDGYRVMKDYPEHRFYSNLVAILSISEAKLGKMKAAKKHGEIALRSAEIKGDLIAIIVANLALGEVAINEKDYGKGKEYLERSLEMCEKYNIRPYIILNSISLMTINLRTNDYSSAVLNGEKALLLLDKKGDMTAIYSTKKNLAEAYFGMKDELKAYKFMKEAHAIFLNKNGIENKRVINELLVKYDTEKKEKALTESRSKLLQEKIDRGNLLLALGLLSIILIGLVLGMLFVRQRNKGRIEFLEMKSEKEIIEAIFEGEELERERIANELHDGVASSLVAARYQLMTNNSIPKKDKAVLETLLLQTHEETRRLSHNLAPIYIDDFGFTSALSKFANDNQTEKCRVNAFVLPSNSTIKKNQANILYRVAQELTQNAKKHANADEISIQVIVDVSKITLIVEDNGKGFDISKVNYSNGIKSIFRRADQLNGNFKIESSIYKGTIATFTI